MTQLLDDEKNGKVSYFLQFGGQGSSYIKELAKLYREDVLKDLFEDIFAGIDDCLNDLSVKKDSAPLPQVLDVKNWL